MIDLADVPPEIRGEFESLVRQAAAQGLAIHARVRDMDEPYCIGYSPKECTLGTHFYSERTADSWYDVIRATRLALQAREAAERRAARGKR